MKVSFVTIKLEGIHGSGKSIVEAALRKAFNEAGIITTSHKTVRGDKIEHEFEIRLTDSKLKELKEFGL